MRANGNIGRDEIITDQTIVDNDITSSYELKSDLIIVQPQMQVH